MKATFRIYDAQIWVDFENTPMARAIWHRSLNLLAANSWGVAEDTEVNKNYPSLRPDHRLGQQKDLYFSSHCADVPSPVKSRLEFKFWQEIVIEPGRKNGGRYSFNQRSLMPYLIRLQWFKTVKLLTAFWLEQGLAQEDSDWPADSPRLGMAGFFYRMRGWKWHLPKDYDPCTFTSSASYNTTSCDKTTIKPGKRYAFYYRGRLHVGTAFYSLNNNYLMFSNENSAPIGVHSGQIYELRTGLPRREPLSLSRQIEKAESRLASLIKSQAFEKCISSRGHLQMLKACSE